MQVTELINRFGFPVVAAIGMGVIIYYVWTWATKEVKPQISETNVTLVALIDRIRTLDNDLIRLNEKVNTILRIREQEQKRRFTDTEPASNFAELSNNPIRSNDDKPVV